MHKRDVKAKQQLRWHSKTDFGQDEHGMRLKSKQPKMQPTATISVSRYLAQTPTKRTFHTEYMQDPLDALTPLLTRLAVATDAFAENSKTLAQANTHLQTFNNAFGHILNAMHVNSRCMQWSETPDEVSWKRFAERKEHRRRRGTLNMNMSTMIASENTFASESFIQNEPDEVLTERKPAKKRAKSSVAPGKTRAPVKKASVFKTDAIVSRLPLKYQDIPHCGVIDVILKKLYENREGAYIHDLVKWTECPKHRVTEYMNALVFSKDVIKMSSKVCNLLNSYSHNCLGYFVQTRFFTTARFFLSL